MVAGVDGAEIENKGLGDGFFVGFDGFCGDFDFVGRDDGDGFVEICVIFLVEVEIGVVDEGRWESLV